MEMHQVQTSGGGGGAGEGGREDQNKSRSNLSNPWLDSSSLKRIMPGYHYKNDNQIVPTPDFLRDSIGNFKF